MSELLTVNNGRFHIADHLREDIEQYVFNVKDRYSDGESEPKPIKYDKRLRKPFPTIFDFWLMAVVRGVIDTRSEGRGKAPEPFEADEYTPVITLVTTRGDARGKFVPHDVEQVLLAIYIADHPPEDTDGYTPSATEIVRYLDRYAAVGTEPLLRDISERMDGNAAAQTVLPHVLLAMSSR